MDNELDFRAGDVVCDIRYGTGKIDNVKFNGAWPFYVNFDNGRTEMYLPDGRDSNLDKLRSLYHGTWEQVFGNLPDLKPKRKVKRWVNLYLSGMLGKGVESKKIYLTEEEAKENANIDAVAVAVEVEVDK